MAQPSGIITILTDFGTKDPFAGVMKGVILSRFREATIVDLAHGVTPQDVTEAVFWLERSFRYFPRGTVHVAVVDPGVGTERAAVVVRLEDHLFVGPDNGLFAGLGGEARAIDLSRWALPNPSATFHGRDVFSPMAAELASWRAVFDEVGPEVQLCAGPAVPKVAIAAGRLEGSVVSIDRFGNVISNVERKMVAALADPVVAVGGVELPLRRTYADVERGELVAVVNAFDTVEVAERDGDAATRLGVSRGDPVVVDSS